VVILLTHSNAGKSCEKSGQGVEEVNLAQKNWHNF